MDFLLECIGFPPDHDLESLARRVRDEGEPVAWRGPRGDHLSLSLGGGLEVRMDQEEGDELCSLYPNFDVQRRLRVALTSLHPVPQSRYDLLLHGLANPPVPGDEYHETAGNDYVMHTYVWDARRIPPRLPRGHVLALSVAGFALDVTYVGPNQGVMDPFLLEEPNGAMLAPAGGAGMPSGCMELSLRIRHVRHITNPITREQVEVLETDAPGRPLDLFVSRWQLAEDGFEVPRPGWRIEGAFLFTGRVSGGLPRRKRTHP